MGWKKGGSVAGTHYVGEIYTTYKKLVKTFGEPEEKDGYKVRVEWRLTFDDGQVATIYDWKVSDEYYGEEGAGIPLEELDVWHVGGHSKKAFWNVVCALGLKKDIIKRIFETENEYEIKMLLR